MITPHKFTFTSGMQFFPIARTDDNIRGHDLLRCSEFAHIIAQGKPFSVSICGGRGEVWMKRINGQWFTKVDSCDQVFGFISGKFRAI